MDMKPMSGVSWKSKQKMRHRWREAASSIQTAFKDTAIVWTKQICFLHSIVFHLSSQVNECGVRCYSKKDWYDNLVKVYKVPAVESNCLINQESEWWLRRLYCWYTWCENMDLNGNHAENICFIVGSTSYLHNVKRNPPGLTNACEDGRIELFL